MSWQLLMRWGIIHPSFPSVLNPNKLYKVKQGVSLEDAFLEESEAVLKVEMEEKQGEQNVKSNDNCFRLLMAISWSNSRKYLRLT